MDPEDNDLDLENVLDDDQDGGDDSDNEQGPATDDDPKDKRIKDLMSKWQSAEARAKKAEQASSAKAPEPQGGATGQEPALPAAVQEWLEAAKAQARDSIFGSDPRFARYGLERSSITGSTPAEMQESAKAMSDFIDKLETEIRAEVLKKHGLSPEVRGTPAPRNKSIADLSDEEFEKWYARQKESF